MTGRVAIYAAPGVRDGDPDATRLRARAESWLGRSVDGGSPDPVLPSGWTRGDVDEITVDARRYGFHGTLKPPFRPAAGTTLAELEREIERFAAGRDAVTVPELTCIRLGRFFALVPGADAPDLHRLADEVVTRFDRFRSPATDTEIARRRPDTLSPRQRELLATWGYPYVLDEFRFHLTLTDRIPPERQRAVGETLEGWFADSIGRTIPVDALALFTEAAPGAPFRLHSVHPLRPANHRAAGTEDDRAAGTDTEGIR
ncbi:DUF1045 domain-containing protein [Williamsia sterculiae]|uniref:Phosphonate metabolism protein n=1 Tax=Williamsia sterculiae TaxID=1344003 RepID=A0A1N7FJY7_9NOCA|nr:DUF1045 domain-containing protein [Williamsia sterculiae]SIS00546.1 Protein of unknown function [Williamsia sterculiae]